MDPVDKAVHWAHYFQRRAGETIQDIKDSSVVTGTTDLFNRTTDSVYDLYKHKLPFGSGIPLQSPAPIRQPPTLLEKLEAFVLNNKRLIAFLIGGAVSASLIYRHYHPHTEHLVTIKNNKKYIKTDKRRRASRLANGARTNVVVIVGSPLEPLVRIIANDLEKRGFIVYITAIDDREITYINNENSEDIRPFLLNSRSEDALNAQIESFGRTVNGTITPFQHASPHHLKLVGVLVIPDLFYPVGPVENMSLRTWSECINGKIMPPLVLFSNKFLDVIRKNNSIVFGDDNKQLNVVATKIVLLTPNLISSINLPFHALETVAINSLQAVFNSLAREIITDSLLNIEVVNLKIGASNIFNHTNSKESEERIKQSLHNQILGWDENMKAVYGSNFKNICLLSGPSPNLRGANLRELNYKIFDLLYHDINNKRKTTYKKDLRVCYVGRGARAYDLIGKCLPSWLVSWFIGCNSLSNIFFRMIGY